MRDTQSGLNVPSLQHGFSRSEQAQTSDDLNNLEKNRSKEIETNSAPPSITNGDRNQKWPPSQLV